MLRTIAFALLVASPASAQAIHDTFSTAPETGLQLIAGTLGLVYIARKRRT